ncbi:MAG TPA: aldehyde dehydrogenase family protein [Tissierellia bacterium]|nr:aldehyde dehydrogenase family protein [Tissierellia bacterium]
MRGLYYDGAWQEPISNDTIEVENPFTRQIIQTVIAASEDDVDRAVKSAKAAFPEWKNTPIDQRIDLIKRLTLRLEARRDDFARIIRDELGCGKDLALNTQFLSYIKGMFTYMEEAKKIELAEDHVSYTVLKEPVGVVGCLTPWNYPFGQIIQKIIPAVIMGNTVVLKPSQKTPLSAIELFKEIDQVGFPPGVFNLTTGRGSEVGNVLATHPDVQMITFTGSTEGGKEIARLASQGIKRVILELGGKSAAVILEGADLNLASKRILFTVCSNVGQTCSAQTRVLYPEGLRDKLIKALERQAKEFPFATPDNHDTRVGVLSSKKQQERVAGYVDQALNDGAELVIGQPPKDQAGYYSELMVLSGVSNSDTIAQEEVFGPVIVLIPYQTEAQALELANDSIYGLSGAVYGPAEQAIEFAKGMDTGQIFINDGSGSGAPFGGYKQSGYGREGGKYGLLEFVELKTIFTP